jgi:hypothetical protein
LHSNFLFEHLQQERADLQILLLGVIFLFAAINFTSFFESGFLRVFMCGLRCIAWTTDFMFSSYVVLCLVDEIFLLFSVVPYFSLAIQYVCGDHM